MHLPRKKAAQAASTQPGGAAPGARRKKLAAAALGVLAGGVLAGGALWAYAGPAVRLARAARACAQQAGQELAAQAAVWEASGLPALAGAEAWQAGFVLRTGPVSGGKNGRYAAFSGLELAGTAAVSPGAQRLALQAEAAAGEAEAQTALFTLELGVAGQTVALRSPQLTAGETLSITASTVYDDYNASIFCTGQPAGGGQSGVVLWQSAAAPLAVLAAPEWLAALPGAAQPYLGGVRVRQAGTTTVQLADGGAVCRQYEVTIPAEDWNALLPALAQAAGAGEPAGPLWQALCAAEEPVQLTCAVKDGVLRAAALAVPAGGGTARLELALAGTQPLLAAWELRLYTPGAPGENGQEQTIRGGCTAAGGRAAVQLETMQQSPQVRTTRLELAYEAGSGALALTLQTISAAGESSLTAEGTLTAEGDGAALELAAAQWSSTAADGAGLTAAVTGSIRVQPGAQAFDTCADGPATSLLGQSWAEFGALAARVAGSLLRDLFTNGKLMDLYNALYTNVR